MAPAEPRSATAVAYPTFGVLLLGGIRDKLSRLPLYPTAGLTYSDGTARTRSRATATPDARGIEIVEAGSTQPGSKESAMHRMAARIVELAGGSETGIRIESANCRIPSGSSDSAAASIGLATATLLGAELPARTLVEAIQLGSESAFRSYYGGLTLTSVVGASTVTRPLLGPSELSGLRIAGLEFGRRKFSADQIHERMVLHPRFPERVVAAERKAKALEQRAAARDLRGILDLAQQDSAEFHELLREVEVRVISDEMAAVTRAVESLRASGVPAGWVVTGGSNVFVLYLRAFEREVVGAVSTAAGGAARIFDVYGGVHLEADVTAGTHAA